MHALSVAKRLSLAALFLSPTAHALSSAPTVTLYGCPETLRFEDCGTSARGALMCTAVNQGDEHLYTVRGIDTRAWSYDGDGKLLNAETGRFADSQILPGGNTHVAFDIGTAAKQVVLCSSDPRDPARPDRPELIQAGVAHRIDPVSAALLTPLLVAGLIALYLTLYGLFTGCFPDFKRKKALKNLLRIGRRRNLAEAMADNWILRDESPLEFWTAEVAGLLTALPLLWFSAPAFLNEVFGWAIW